MSEPLTAAIPAGRSHEEHQQHHSDAAERDGAPLSGDVASELSPTRSTACLLALVAIELVWVAGLLYLLGVLVSLI